MILRLLTTSFVFGLASCISSPAIEQTQIDCPGAIDPAASGVYTARAAFNRAIVDKDTEALAALLASDVTLVTGSDSTIFSGRAAQLSLWREDFAAAERTVYERKTECVSVSPILPIAFETGAWEGVRTDDPGAFAGGRYSAKWRREDGAWTLEAEIFSTERCGGSFCPAESP